MEQLKIIINGYLIYLILTYCIMFNFHYMLFHLEPMYNKLKNSGMFQLINKIKYIHHLEACTYLIYVTVLSNYNLYVKHVLLRLYFIVILRSTKKKKKYQVFR